MSRGTPWTDAAPTAIEHLLAQFPASVVGQYLTHGYLITQVVYACAKLGLCDLVKHGPVPVEVLAEQSKTHPQGLYRLMRCAATLGVFDEQDERVFAPTPISESLLTNSPLWLRTMVHVELHYRVMEGLVDAIRTNEPQYEPIFGMGMWDRMRADPELNGLFSRTMAARDGLTEAVMQIDPFQDTRELVDIGGALGAVTRAVLSKHAEAKAILFDRPDVISELDSISGWDLGGRIRAEGGDFFERVPSGDTYLLSRVLHDWDDASSIKILRSCRAAATPDARLVVVESLMPGPNHGARVKLLDLCMLTSFGGVERSYDEFRELLHQAGWQLDKAYATRTTWYVLVARAA